jgi:hypothetical protein
MIRAGLIPYLNLANLIFPPGILAGGALIGD